MTTLDSIHFKNLSARLMANIVDNILVTLMTFFVVVILTFSSFEVFNTENFTQMFSINMLTSGGIADPYELIQGMLFFSITMILLYTAIGLVYFQLLLAGKKRATYGMEMFGLELQSLNGSELSAIKIILRNVLFVILKFLYIGTLSFFTIAFTEKHQGLHGMPVSTTVGFKK